VCRIGDGDVTSAAQLIFDTNIVINGNLINYLKDPVSAQDAATKSYVDSLAMLNHDGHIPLLAANEAQTGFVVSASSYYNSYQPHYALAPS
jgi:hypothetical protein